LCRHHVHGQPGCVRRHVVPGRRTDARADRPRRQARVGVLHGRRRRSRLVSHLAAVLHWRHSPAEEEQWKLSLIVVNNQRNSTVNCSHRSLRNSRRLKKTKNHVTQNASSHGSSVSCWMTKFSKGSFTPDASRCVAVVPHWNTLNKPGVFREDVTPHGTQRHAPHTRATHRNASDVNESLVCASVDEINGVCISNCVHIVVIHRLLSTVPYFIP